MKTWVLSRSEGAGNATCRKTRGLVRAVIRLITPPLPAVSRPSKTTMMRAPSAWTQACRRVSSTCNFASSFSNSLRLILPDAVIASSASCFFLLSFAIWRRSHCLLGVARPNTLPAPVTCLQFVSTPKRADRLLADLIALATVVDYSASLGPPSPPSPHDEFRGSAKQLNQPSERSTLRQAV